MQTKTYILHDRSDWPKGEWDSEVDAMQWTDEKTGYLCVFRRTEGGSICGYIAIPRNHPKAGEKDTNCDLDVHGGVTWSSGLAEHPIIELEPEDPKDLWLIGFDCAHWSDFVPGIPVLASIGGTYRNVDYVITEIEHLARQLKETE